MNMGGKIRVAVGEFFSSWCRRLELLNVFALVLVMVLSTSPICLAQEAEGGLWQLGKSHSFK